MSRILLIKPSQREIGSFRFSYYGSFPERAVFLSTSGKASDQVCAKLYLSALEASLNGYGVVYVVGTKGSGYIEQGTYDGKGTLYGVIPFEIEKLYPNKASRIIESGGGIAVAGEINIARCIAVEISDAIVVSEEKCSQLQYLPQVEYALATSKEIAILREALTSRALRNLVIEGCPIISSFSDFLSSPRAIGYISERGMYGKDGTHFDIIYLDE